MRRPTTLGRAQSQPIQTAQFFPIEPFPIRLLPIWFFPIWPAASRCAPIWHITVWSFTVRPCAIWHVAIQLRPVQRAPVRLERTGKAAVARATLEHARG